METSHSAITRIQELLSDSKTGLVEKTQTTFLDVSIQDLQAKTSEKFRIHFIGKKELRIRKQKFENANLVDGHPLLLKYGEETYDLHIDGFVADKNEFSNRLKQVCLEVFGDWREVEHFLNMDLNKFLENRYGILLTGPKSFVNKVLELATEFEIEMFLRNRRSRSGAYSCLLLDRCYVIAERFRIEELGRPLHQ